jgi:hypothetical protein
MLGGIERKTEPFSKEDEKFGPVEMPWEYAFDAVLLINIFYKH